MSANESSFNKVLNNSHKIASEIVKLWNQHIWNMNLSDSNGDMFMYSKYAYIEFNEEEFNHTWYNDKEYFEIMPHTLYNNQDFACLANSIR